MPKQEHAKTSKYMSPLAHIRLKPGMYINHTQNITVITREIIDNALDEVMDDAADTIWVTIHPDHSISVRDNGRGMPVTPIEVDNGRMLPNARASWTIPNVGSHFEETDITKTSSGTHGVGSKTTVATSDHFIGEIWLDGKYYYDEYVYDPETKQPGVPVVELSDKGEYIPHKQTPENTPEGFTHGTRVHYWPSPDVFDTIKIDWEWLKRHMHQQTYLHKNLTVHLDNQVKNEQVTYHEDAGLKGYLSETLKQVDGKPITQIHEVHGQIQTDKTNLEADIVFAWTDSHNMTEIAFTNSVYNSQGGTHVDGFNNGVMKLLNNYAEKFNMVKEPLEARDTRPGLVAIISIKYSDPMYGSQTKEALTTPAVKSMMQKIIMSQGEFELDKYVQDVEAIIKQAVLRADARKKVDDLTNIKLDMKALNFNASKKLAPAKKTGSKVNAELYIVEGDSAGGGLKHTRIQDDNAKLYQAVMPIRGKIINAAKATPEKVFANEEIATIIAALGAGYGKDFDESKLNYQKLIIATDADSDGAQIAMLIRMFTFKYMRPLIENGHVYRALSPLYVNEIKNTENNGTHEVYTYTEKEQTQFLAKTDDNDIKEISRYKGLGEMNDELIFKTMIQPGTRRLYRFTVEDFDKAYANAELLQGPEVGPRREFLFENAQFAEILD